MALTQRERMIAFGAGGAVVLLGLNYFALTPYLDRHRAIAEERDNAQRDLDYARHKIHDQHRMQRVWDDLSRGGLKSDPSEAESQVQHALLDWARESGLGQVSLKADQPKVENKGGNRFQQTGFQMSGTGPMASVSKLLWRVETTPMPLKINLVQLTPHKEGTDDLQFQLSVSNLCLLPEADKTERADRGDRGRPAETADAGRPKGGRS